MRSSFRVEFLHDTSTRVQEIHLKGPSGERQVHDPGFRSIAEADGNIIGRACWCFAGYVGDILALRVHDARERTCEQER